MDEHDRRVGLNEALFREVNAQVRELSEEAGLETIEILCECGDGSCTERFAISIDDYEELRSDPSCFAIRPGHVAPSSEGVVADRGDYEIVKKRPGGPKGLAAETNPA